ncbi:MAG TPA: prolyl oligopeptidase family serine peptidase, partial [Planctomycetota bacterium]|nr:prolyl oligopeptidase family serine peptidase [Planctomycetota bacterium]
MLVPLLGLALAAGATAQDGVDPLDALDARAAEVLGGIERIRDRAAHDREVPRLRNCLREAIGIDRLPAPRARNVQVVGSLRFDGYRVEKLVYETFPGAEVPAHLYLPEKAEGRRPAVLFVPGHWFADSKSKTDFQQMCAGLASLGMVVLAYDPVGQGERGVSLRDHRRTELLAVGVSQQAIMVFESACALELLRGRADVDPDRIGITGASGGGFNSWIMAALDPRIACAVPVVGTSDFLEQLRAVRERDWYEAKEHCHFIPGLLRFANNHELLAMILPRPVMVIAAHNDHGFRIPGNRAVVEYGRALGDTLGSPGRVGYFEDDAEGHGYGPRKRAAALGWLARWLLGEEIDGARFAERTVPAWDAPELRCFRENRPAGPAIVAFAEDLASRRAPAAGVPDVAGVLGLPLPPRLTSAPKLEREGDRLRWRMRDGVVLTGELRAPAGPWRGAILAAGDGEAGAPGYAVVRIALRDALRSPGWTYASSLLLGESVVGRQAMDLVGAWRSLRVLPELEGKPIVISGDGLFESMAAIFAAR